MTDNSLEKHYQVPIDSTVVNTMHEHIKPPDPDSSDLTTSDASSTSAKSSDGYDPGTNEPTTSGTSSESDVLFTSDDDMTEDVETTIEYLREKRGLLKRASSVLFDHEEAYDASTARATAAASAFSNTTSPPASLWDQAKRMVPCSKPVLLKGRTKRTATGPNTGQQKAVKPSPRDPLIHLDEVQHVAAAKFDEAEPGNDEGDNGSMEELPEVAFSLRQWMAQGLIRSSDNFSSDAPAAPDDCTWKVISDPLTCSLGLVPPPSISMEHGISIEEALSISNEGRLLTQATPPFCVVYVNKAFMILTGTQAKESLIGQPVESILQVRQDLLGTPKTNPDQDFLCAHFLRSTVAPVLPEDDSAGEEFVSCRMMIVPVMDRSRRRRLTPHARYAKQYTCMSHVLIRVRESERAVSPLSSSSQDQMDDTFTVSDSDSRKEDSSSSSCSSCATNQDSIRSTMMGTIG